MASNILTIIILNLSWKWFQNMFAISRHYWHYRPSIRTDEWLVYVFEEELL